MGFWLRLPREPVKFARWLALAHGQGEKGQNGEGAPGGPLARPGDQPIRLYDLRLPAIPLSVDKPLHNPVRNPTKPPDGNRQDGLPVFAAGRCARLWPQLFAPLGRVFCGGGLAKLW